MILILFNLIICLEYQFTTLYIYTNINTYKINSIRDKSFHKHHLNEIYRVYTSRKKMILLFFFVNKKRIFTFVSFIHSGFNEPSWLSFPVDAELLFFTLLWDTVVRHNENGHLVGVVLGKKNHLWLCHKYQSLVFRNYDFVLVHWHSIVVISFYVRHKICAWNYFKSKRSINSFYVVCNF